MGGIEREVMSQSFLVNANGSPYEHPSIVVIGRQPLSRSCLARVLKAEFPDFAILEIETAQQFDSIVTKRISLIMVDIGDCPLTDEGLLQSLAHIHRPSAEGPVVLLTGVDETAITDAMIAEIMRFGVKGYVTGAASIEIALAAFRLVIAGGIYFPRSVVDYRDWTLASSDAAASQPPVAGANGAANEVPAIVNKAKVAFTARERQVLATLLRGMSNKVIASELNLSQNTVKSHISRIMHKLHAKNRTEAVILSQFSAATANIGEAGGISDA
jgi:DNA-binding NarL/FixJ family response regulator